MNRTLLVTLASLALALPAAAQSSSTPVIGFYKVTIPAGTSAWTCSFVTKKDFQGAASSIVGGPTTSLVNVSGSPFTPAAFNLHYIEILSGPHAGMVFDIETTPANTASAITVKGNLGAGGLALTGTETFCIRKHATISSILSAGGGLTPIDDSVEVFSSTGSSTILTWDGTQWVDGVDFVTPKDVIVYPLQGFKVNSLSGATVTFGGGAVSYVKQGPTKAPVYSGVVNLVGVLSPLADTVSVDPMFSTPLSSLGLGSLFPVDDLVTRFSTNGLMTETFYAHDGTLVVDGIDFVTPKGADRISNSQAFQISPLSDGVYTQPQLTP